MKQEEMVRLIKQIVESMNNIIKIIDDKYLLVYSTNWEKKDNETLLGAYNWLARINRTTWRSVILTWKLQQAKHWESYFKHDDCNDLREMRMLKEDFAQFRKCIAFHRRPRIFIKRIKKDDKKDLIHSNTKNS